MGHVRGADGMDVSAKGGAGQALRNNSAIDYGTGWGIPAGEDNRAGGVKSRGLRRCWRLQP